MYFTHEAHFYLLEVRYEQLYVDAGRKRDFQFANCSEQQNSFILLTI